ncbi:MAG: multidrug effflux MFS transporter [Steroidobacteraceae bacterium]|nr:multidrug effflux MFS transporter [Steroidobacteraceae bacterium]MDW8259358.1 multidrug effflux MFS transporter [Gammaproteobacteria bacterium]
MSAASTSAATQRTGAGLIALLAACSALGVVMNNLLLPALPAIQRSFAESTAAVQATISSYLIAFAVAILLAGPLSDRVGRRPVLLGGMAVFIAGSLCCALAPTLTWLIVGRTVQALGAAAALTIARAAAGDRFQGAALAHAFAIITMAMMVGTTLAPALGGYLVQWRGWRSGFWLMMVVATLVAASTFLLLPESRRTDFASDSIGALWRATGRLLAERLFAGFALQVALIYATYLTFVAVAPYIMVRSFGQREVDYGLYFMLLAAGYFAGNLYVATLGKRVDARRLMFVGISLQFAGSLLGVTLALAGQWNALALFLPQVPVAFGQGLALPHLTSRAVQLAPQYPGIASSLLGFAQQAAAGLTVQLMGLASTATPVPITAFCCAASLIAFVALIALTRSPGTVSASPQPR